MPSSNTAHSATELPLELVCCGSEIVSAEDKILRPDEPVSTRIPLIVWQLVVLPGTQTVTLVKAPSTYLKSGPALTAMVCTVETGLGPFWDGSDTLLLPPPHPNISIEATNNPKGRKIREGNALIGSPLGAYPQA